MITAIVEMPFSNFMHISLFGLRACAFGLLASIGLVTPKRKSLDVDLRLIAKNCFRVSDLLFDVRANSYGHAETLAVQRDVKQ